MNGRRPIDDQPVNHERLRPLRVAVTDLHAVLLHRRARDLGAEPDIEAQFLEVPRGFLGELRIGHRQELGQRLQHHGFGAEPAPDAAELEPDHAGTDHAQPLRHHGKVERAPGIHDAIAIEGGAAQRHRLRTGSQHHVFRLQHALAAVVAREFDLAAGQQAAVTGERRHAGALE